MSDIRRWLAVKSRRAAVRCAYNAHMRKLCLMWGLGSCLAVAAAGSWASDAWDLIHPDQFDWQSQVQRQGIAADLASRISLLAAVVPAQSDEELEGLKSREAELAALGDAATPRQRSRLYLSRAYQHRRLRDLLQGMLDALRCVRGAREVPKEMHCWSQASVLLMDEETINISLSVLRQGRMMPRDEDMPVKAQDPKVWYGEYGRGIVRHIIRPYLASLSGDSSDA